jgi:predicted LPLAT superfamily acyltransferase
VTGEAPGPAAAWTGRTRGGTVGNRFFIVVLRALGLRAAYACLAFVAAYFLFAARPAYRSSVDYLRRLRGPVPFFRRVWAVYRHFFSFGVMLLDRVAILGGRGGRFTYVLEGEEHIRSALAQGRGAVLLGAHVGNWEAAGHAVGRYGVPVHLVGVDRETEPIRRLLAGAMADRRVQVIQASGGPAPSVEMLAALRRGEVVAMLGDRAFGSATVRAPFLGATAGFPGGAYILAAVAGAPLIQTFAMRERGFRYRLIAFPPDPMQLPPRDRRRAFLESCARRYAERLESMLRRYPDQWYNFYPFWDAAP